MSGLCFHRPVGAGADVKELEYIIALHQTSKETRANATVSSMDIVALLRSRHSLQITHEQAIQIVRSLGGGDTGVNYPSMSDKDGGTSLSTSGKAKNGVWQKAVGGLHSILHHSNKEEEPELPSDEQNIRKEEEEEPNLSSEAPGGEEGKEGHISATTSHIMSSTMKKLRGLNAMKRLGKTDTYRLHVMAEDVADDLRAKVLLKTKSAAVLRPVDTAKKGDQQQTSTDPNASPEENTFLDSVKPNDANDLEDNSNLSSTVLEKPKEPDGIGADQQARSVAFVDGISNVKDEPDGEPNQHIDENRDDKELLPEYVDLVQVLSTILIPKFARLAYDAKNETTKADDETIDRGTQNLDDPGLGSRLKNRFVSYGRRKLQINDAATLSCPAKDVLELGRRALLKTIPGDEDPVMDETLVQLLLLINGEIDRANDEQLVKEMVKVANSASGRFDEDSLINAISSDLSAWDPTCVDTPTTFFYDVFGVALPSIKTKLKKEDKVEEVRTTDEEGGAQEKLSPSGDDKEVPSVNLKPGSDEVPEKQRLSLLARCFKFLLPVVYAISHDKLEF
ncbi:hypothetical protein ACA910_006160 [Epithemia clementina (nom. ined.)]